MPRLISRLTPLAVSGAVWFGCSSIGGADSEAKVTVLLTDAPNVMFETAMVTIGEVWLVPTDEAGDRVLLSEAGGTFDLLQLSNGITTTLADQVVPPGQYSQLRLIVESASVTLAEDFTFEDGTTAMPLKIPSGAQSGIKIKLRGETDEEGGLAITEETALVVDFDVLQNFKIQGNPNTPAGLKGVLFTPLLRAVVITGAGSISGIVGDGTNPVPGATVKATRQNTTTEEGETSEATAITAADGSYTIRFLRPGTYEVSVESDAGTADPQTVEVPINTDVIDVNFTLVP